MTIIKPKATTDFRKFFLIFLGIIIFGGGFYILEYSFTAKIRHEINLVKVQVSDLQKENSTIELELYSKIDPVNLEKLATNSGLTLDKTPSYLGNN